MRIRFQSILLVTLLLVALSIGLMAPGAQQQSPQPYTPGQLNPNNITFGDLTVTRAGIDCGRIFMGSTLHYVDYGCTTSGEFSFLGGLVQMPSGLMATGTKPTITGTGTCASSGSQIGGAWSGSFACTGTAGAATITITFGNTSFNGWNCAKTQDQTTVADTINQTSSSTTACNLSAAAIAANDVIIFSGFPY